MLVSHFGFQSAHAELAAIVKLSPMCYKQKTYNV
jgi:hypothetical protein